MAQTASFNGDNTFKQELDNMKQQKNDQNVVRKVFYLPQDDRKQQNRHHIGCVIVFLDKEQDKYQIFCLHSDDYEFVKSYIDEHKLPVDKNNLFLVDIQKDTTSCMTTAIEATKSLTIDWYKKVKPQLQNLKENIDKKINEAKKEYDVIEGFIHEYELEDIGKETFDHMVFFRNSIDNFIKNNEGHTNIDPSLLPDKLIGYLQYDLYKIKELKPELFQKLLDKGYIKKVERTVFNDTLQLVRKEQIHNLHLQERTNYIVNDYFKQESIDKRKNKKDNQHIQEHQEKEDKQLNKFSHENKKEDKEQEKTENNSETILLRDKLIYKKKEEKEEETEKKENNNEELQEEKKNEQKNNTILKHANNIEEGEENVGTKTNYQPQENLYQQEECWLARQSMPMKIFLNAITFGLINLNRLSCCNEESVNVKD